MRRRGQIARLAASVLAVGLGTRAARADAPQTAPEAEALFQAGKTAMAARDYASACPKLAESNRIDPGTGTLLALAICHEAWGKTASAWAEFTEVATDAHSEGRADREAFARQRVAALAPHLPRLIVQVPEDMTKVAGLEVTRDGVPVGSAAWGIAVPVDPGMHAIEVSVPGRPPWRETVDAPSGAPTVVRVQPSLTAAAAPAVERAPVATPNGRRTAAFVAGAAGVVAVGVGTYFGVETIAKNDDAKSLCAPPRCANQTAVDDSRDARTFADVADVAIAAGLVGLGTMAYLLMTADPPDRPSDPSAIATPRFSPFAGPAVAGIALSGRF